MEFSSPKKRAAKREAKIVLCGWRLTSLLKNGKFNIFHLLALFFPRRPRGCLIILHEASLNFLEKGLGSVFLRTLVGLFNQFILH
jgi:hypothetical protein